MYVNLFYNKVTESAAGPLFSHMLRAEQSVRDLRLSHPITISAEHNILQKQA